MATNASGHMICSYTLLISMNQRVLNKLSKEHNIISHVKIKVRELPQSYCGDNREGTMFSELHIYITPISFL